MSIVSASAQYMEGLTIHLHNNLAANPLFVIKSQYSDR